MGMNCFLLDLSFIMRLVILDNYDQVSEWAAKYVRNKILKFNPGPDKYFVLGLPTGKLRQDNLRLLLNFWSDCSLIYIHLHVSESFVE